MLSMREAWSPELIAVQFSPENTPSGWKMIDQIGTSPLHIRRNREGLVYIFPATFWPSVQKLLQEASIPYHYHTALSIPKEALSRTNQWINSGIKPESST